MSALVIVLVCLFLNSIMSCAEMAFVTVDKKKIRNKSLGGDTRASIIEKMQVTPERFLSAVQIGITLVGAISAAVGGVGAEEKITPLLVAYLNINVALAETIAIIMVVVPITFLSVVVGELVPKSIALKYSLPIILKLSYSIKWIEKFLNPLVAPMEKTTKFILKFLLRSKFETEIQSEIDDVSLLGLKKEHKQYILNLIDLESKIIKNIMVPWNEVNYVLYEEEARDVLNKILDTRRTRLPVIADKDVCGFLHAKEFLNLFKSGVADNWVSFIRPPRFISKETKLLDALKIMQKQKIHIFIVGSDQNPEGIITLEDVLEEVIGDITDEDEDNNVKHYIRRSIFTDTTRSFL
ncbi:MAG: HlyC/CorC family transporter [Oligoflexia bacterium]|nr:HlyC/CorC family transporter [Oligoflexia bacterium]